MRSFLCILCLALGSVSFAQPALPDAPAVALAESSPPALPFAVAPAPAPAPVETPGSFFASPGNRTLAVYEFAARGLDAYTSYLAFNNPCHCFRETSAMFGMNLQPLFKNVGTGMAYSLGVATGYVSLANYLYRVSAKHPKHGKLWRGAARSLLLGDAAVETVYLLNNVNNELYARSGPALR